MELNNSGTLKSTVEKSIVELLNQLWNWAFQLWNMKIHCGLINCGRKQKISLWTTVDNCGLVVHPSTVRPIIAQWSCGIVELWKNISEVLNHFGCTSCTRQSVMPYHACTWQVIYINAQQQHD
jgi:hypothetical protein